MAAMKMREVVGIAILPVIARLAGVDPPADRVLDGCDASGLVLGAPGVQPPREELFFHVERLATRLAAFDAELTAAVRPCGKLPVAPPVGPPGRAGDAVPARVLDLSGWKLTLPVDTDRPGRPDEVEKDALQSFAAPGFFFVNDAGDGVVFRAPCGGATTRGSGFPRCELREMKPGGGDEIAWSTDDAAIHVLAARMAVTRTPPVKPHVVCAQIHDAEDDLLMIRLEGRKLFVERNDAGDVELDREYELGRWFDLRIEAGGGRVGVWYNGVRKLDWKVSRAGCYFKAGCYTQSNPSKGDRPDACGEVVIRRLSIAP
jgi:poly(beta-D-mannuronate) lyase